MAFTWRSSTPTNSSEAVSSEAKNRPRNRSQFSLTFLTRSPEVARAATFAAMTGEGIVAKAAVQAHITQVAEVLTARVKDGTFLLVSHIFKKRGEQAESPKC